MKISLDSHDPDDMDPHAVPPWPRDSGLSRRLQEHWRAQAPTLDTEAAWQRLQAQLPPAPGRVRNRAAAWLSGLRAWWLPSLSFAGGAACAALFMALLMPTTSLPPARAPGTFSALSGTPAPAKGTRLQVAFAADARMADIDALLRKVDASVVGGPSALGLYTLEVQPGAAAQALRRLRQSPLVDSATRAPQS